MVQGHVDDLGRIVAITPEGDARLVRIEAPPGVMRYVVDKGFIAVDGISLTVATHDAGSFQVSIVGHTRDNTIMGTRRVGEMVNLEVDIIAKYVEKMTGQSGSNITWDFLREHGF